MRIATLALISMLGVCVAFPAAAAKKRHVSEATFNSFYTCEKRAQDQGLVHGQHGHTEFVRECMGMRPSSPVSGNR
jgi:hypothetical protein